MSESPLVTGDPVRTMWREVVARAKDLVTLPSFWQALDATEAIALDGDRFVVGLRPPDFFQRGLLLDARHRNTLEKELAQRIGREVSLRVVEGITLEDWQLAKEIERQAAVARQAAMQRREASVAATATGAETWEAIGERLARQHASLHHRALPAVAGEYVVEAVRTIAEAYERLMPTEGEPTEADLRAYSRVLDRVAERVGAPPALIAYLVLQERARR